MIDRQNSAFHDGAEQPLFGFEMVLREREGGLGSFRNLAHGHAMVAPLGELGFGGVEYAIFDVGSGFQCFKVK